MFNKRTYIRHIVVNPPPREVYDTQREEMRQELPPLVDTVQRFEAQYGGAWTTIKPKGTSNPQVRVRSRTLYPSTWT